MPTFELETQETDDPHLAHVNLAGELDLTNAQDLEESLDGLARNDTTTVVLDLNRVIFIDSAALHVLFRVGRRLGKKRLGIVLAPGAPIMRTLQIVALPHALVTAESLESVLDALARA